MSTREIRLPALSPTMEEVVLLAWKVAPGDTITDGQPIAEVSTAWVDMDLEAPFPGTIVELLVGAGDTVALGQTIATLVTDDTFAAIGLSAAKSEASPPGQGAEPTTDPRGGVGIVGASPPARKMARELGIDLSVVEATGVRGQVTPLDVKRYHELSSVPQMEAPLEAAPADTAVAAPPQQASPVPDTTDTAPPPPAPIPDTTSTAPPPPAPAPDTTSTAPPPPAPIPDTTSTAPPPPAPVSEAKRMAVRRATVGMMNRTATVPQFTLWRTLQLDTAAAHKGGMGWTTLLVRSLAAALGEHPELNARWDDDERQPVPFSGRAVSIAVDRPGVGLIVVTLPDPSAMDPMEADRATRALIDRARAGKVRPDDMAQGSITLSDLGATGVDQFNALLFPPQAATLSIGSIRHRPIATRDGGLKAVRTAEVGLTIDHRVADPADGARYLDTFARLVEAGR